MGRDKKRSASTDFVLFDVFYEDGSRSSNRRIPASELDGPDADARVREIIEEQDSRISEKSGKARLNVKSVVRSSRR